MINLKLRNVKPYAATMKEWREWRKRAKSEEPFRYWLNETVPEFLSNIWTTVTKPFNDLRYWIRCRFFDKYHMLNTGLKPGYADCDTRMLHGMFNLLVDYIEVEKAWMHVVFDKDERAKRKHPWWSHGLTRFKAFRDVAAGLAYLNWEMSLDDPKLDEYERSDTQAASAREQLAIYNWWKQIRPNRPDPYDASGWTDYCEKTRNGSGNHFPWDDERTPEEEIESRIALDKLQAIEKSYDDEDEEYLIRLIRIRKSLWT